MRRTTTWTSEGPPTHSPPPCLRSHIPTTWAQRRPRLAGKMGGRGLRSGASILFYEMLTL